MRASRSLVAGFVLSIALSCSTNVAFADDDADPNAAQSDQLFNEGRDLMAKGQYAQACPKFEESHKLRPGIGTLFNLADCHEKLGKLVDAYTEFQEVVERTKAALQPDREKIAEDRVAAPEKKLSKLVITVPSTTLRVTISLDNVALTPDRINVPLVVPAGDHAIKATTDRDNGEPFETTVTLPGNGVTTTVAIPVAPGAKMKRNTGMLVAGGILTGLGGLGILVGIGVAVTADSDGGAAVGGGVALGGVVCLAVGIPLLAVGNKKRPVVTASGEDVFEASPIPQIGLGIGSASATWHF